MATTRTHAEFQERLKALGYTTVRQAAAALGLDHAGIWRMWSGERPITLPTWDRLEDLEHAQPAPMGKLARRLLRELEAAEPGALAAVPVPANNIERGIDWQPVYSEMEASGLITWWRERPVLTELGARAAAFAKERGL